MDQWSNISCLWLVSSKVLRGLLCIIDSFCIYPISVLEVYFKRIHFIPKRQNILGCHALIKGTLFPIRGDDWPLKACVPQNFNQNSHLKL